jgi:hypothetical protein
VVRADGGGGGGGGGGSGAVLYEMSDSSATYYYDVASPCPQDTSGYPETDGYPTCTSWEGGAKTIRQYNTDNIVAIDNTVLTADTRAQLCGKKVLVFKDGQQVAAPDGGDFFVWDGCEACRGGGRIDFSATGARMVDGDACSLGVVPGVSFQVVDEQVLPFVP